MFWEGLRGSEGLHGVFWEGLEGSEGSWRPVVSVIRHQQGPAVHLVVTSGHHALTGHRPYLRLVMDYSR